LEERLIADVKSDTLLGPKQADDADYEREWDCDSGAKPGPAAVQPDREEGQGDDQKLASVHAKIESKQCDDKLMLGERNGA
jgi:hypothetical protein